MSKGIPEGWSIQTLDGNINILTGYPFSSLLFTNISKFQGLIRIRDLENQKIETFYSGEYEEQYVVKKGDILIGMDGDFNIVKWKAGKALLNQRICKLRAETGSGFDTDFLFHSLMEDLPSINAATGATTVKHLSVRDLRDIEKAYPPLPEQKKIAAILSSVDNVIEKTRAQIDKLKDLKTGMMQELLTKGIGHTEFKDSPVGRIPLDWKVLPLELIIEEVVDCEHKTAPYVESSEFLVVRTSNVRDGELVYDDMRFTTSEAFSEWTKRAVPSYGDVLFTREAPAGEACMVPADVKLCMGQRMVLLRPKTDTVYPDYFSLYITSEIAKLAIYKLSVGTTVTRINIEDIKDIPCLVPSLKEQKEIQLKISSIQSMINKSTFLLKSNEKIKKALMQDLLTGKVRVNVD